MGYARSPFRDSESYLRIVVGLDEGDIQLVLQQSKLWLITYEIPLDIYTIQDILEVVYTMGDHEGTLQFEYDVLSMKTKLILSRFGIKFGRLRFGEKFFFNSLLGFTHYWD